MLRQLIPLMTSALTLTSMWLAGNKDPRAWMVGLGNQVLWAATIVTFGTWGLVPLWVALVVIYSRNLRRWRAHG